MAMHETGHGEHTIVDWYNFHRDVCAQYFLDHPTIIGGPGTIVEIDESKFGRRKYNRGRYQDGHWVFGRIPSLGMQHQRVNHSLNFVDPSTGAHTQSIESTWSQTKRMMRRRGVMNTSSSLFPTYLQEFLWRKKFATDDPFFKILDHIQEQYPLP